MKLPDGWRQVHTQKFERCDGVTVAMWGDHVWAYRTPDIMHSPIYATAEAAILAANNAHPLPSRVAVSPEHMEMGRQIASTIWHEAFACAIRVLRSIADEMEQGNLPPMCGQCAMGFAIETLQKIEAQQQGGVALMEPAGNA